MESIINKLPGDLKKVAKVIGVENTMFLVDHFGGSYLIIPKCDGIRKEVRDNKIRKLYDLGKFTIRELAWKFKLTDRSIQTILNKEDQEVPLPLFEFIKNKK